jgi:predicted RND superfamily exporter protein
LGKRESAIKSTSDTAASILSPAVILTIAGVTLGIISSNGIISQLGLILGRGAAISAGMVLLFLPACLVILDGFIQRTTLLGKGVLANEKKKA